MTELTYPYDARAFELVKQSHRQDGTSTLLLDGEELPVVLRDVQVTMDESWSPFVQFQAEGVAPEDAALLARIDPRAKAMVDVRAGYVYEDGTADIQRLALVQLQSRRAILPSNSMPLVGHGAELRAHESKWIKATTTKTFTGVMEALQFLVNYAQGNKTAAWIASVDPGYRPDLVSAVVLEQGADVWSVMNEIALSAELRLWADENGVWNLAPKVTLAGVTAAFLVQGPNTTVKEVEDVLSRDGWYTAAVLKYTWRDAGGVDQVVYGTYAPAAPSGLDQGAGCCTYSAERTGPISQYQANLNAKSVVSNLSTRGDSYVVKSVAMYWLRPGMTVQVDLANGTSARHIIRRIAFQVSTGTMTLTTREPNNTEE
jgi:hypothetical protein